LVRLLFERGQFGPDDTVRAAGMIACYGAGVWAYCALPVVVRGFYALGDRLTPVRIGLLVVGLNLVLNLVLIWPLAERGLAVATATAAAVQVCVLVAVFSRRRVRLEWHALRKTLARTVVATAAMAATGCAALWLLPEHPSLVSQLARVAVPLILCAGVYYGVYWMLGGREIGMLLGRHGPSPGETSGLDWFEEHTDYEEE